jgi:hypothetical protein
MYFDLLFIMKNQNTLLRTTCDEQQGIYHEYENKK